MKMAMSSNFDEDDFDNQDEAGSNAAAVDSAEDANGKVKRMIAIVPKPMKIRHLL